MKRKDWNREHTLDVIYTMAVFLTKTYKRSVAEQMWTIANDFNSDHEDEEIFLCDHESEATGMIDGVYVEDNYFIFAE